MDTRRFLFVALAGITCASAASAAITGGAPITIAHNNTQVTVEFLNSDAGHTGHLYFLGSGTETSIVDLATDTAEPGLGQFLFSNHDAGAGDAMTLAGIFNAGDVLHFAYDVVAPSYAADELYRSDWSNDAGQFAWDAAAGMLAMEDLRLPQGDMDYNDAVFALHFQQVPAPAAMALFGAALALAPRRRRR